MREIVFHNGFHLGDCVFHVHYLRNLCMQNEDLSFTFYIKKKYIKEMSYHLVGFENRIKLGSLKDQQIFETQTGIKTIDSWYASKKLKTGKKLFSRRLLISLLPIEVM